MMTGSYSRNSPQIRRNVPPSYSGSRSKPWKKPVGSRFVVTAVRT
jgi:hypothetical protein